MLILNSCSSDSPLPENIEPATINSDTENNTVYNFNSDELEALELINNHRISIGLNPLIKSNFISIKCKEHDDFMILNKVLAHTNFESRSKEIFDVLNATKVGENIAFNFNKPQDAFNGWLLSGEHKKNIEGDYTHFGIAIAENEDGQKYYTNIFAKI